MYCLFSCVQTSTWRNNNITRHHSEERHPYKPCFFPLKLIRFREIPDRLTPFTHTHKQSSCLNQSDKTLLSSFLNDAAPLFIHSFSCRLSWCNFISRTRESKVYNTSWGCITAALSNPGVTLSTKYTIGTLHFRHFNVEMLHFFTFNIVLCSKNFFCQAQWRPIVQIIQRNECDNTIDNTKLKNHAVTDTHLPTQQYTPHTSSTSWHTHRHITHTPTRKSLASFQIPQRFRFHFI